MKTLFLLRGLPGAGKSTLAKAIGGIHIEADQYFMKGNEYKFDATQIEKAHSYCQSQTEQWMGSNSLQVNTDRIIVSNTFTQEWELAPYYQLAEKYGYTVFSLVVENRHGGVNIHNAPQEIIEKMRNRFTLKL